ncbi:unnamed protein product [Clonostachys byssicola]|uniref:C2H2-type domain-containing protein n=1 Tax=Clonostachys byssicola TaxID=160290 RepID=A0A9N9U7K6_9HYPO|nr:unnamed protein product [Clonostachys byssicola]
MHFSALIIATGLMSALSGVSAHGHGDGVARLGARSSKQILHMALRSINNDEADAIVARYYEEAGLAERDFGDDLVSNLMTRNPQCPICHKQLSASNGDLANHMRDEHGAPGSGYGRAGGRQPANRKLV